MLSRRILTLLSLLSLAYAHTVITYPGWRGDNLHSVGTVEETNGLGTFDTNNETLFPYGMQWMYPCKSSSPSLAFHSSTTIANLDFPRWWNANLSKQDQMASPRRWCRIPAWLVHRSRNGFHLYQPWPRHHTAEYVTFHAQRCPTYRTFERPLPWQLLLSTGPTPCKHHRERG